MAALPMFQAAIQAHDGQGAAARIAFSQLSRIEQRALVKFVLSL